MIENFIQELTFSLESFGTGAYLLVSLVVLFETIVVIGQFVPGSLLLVLVGFLCFMGVFDFNAMLFSVFLAHLAGEYLNYALGRYKGRVMFHEDSRFFKPRFLDMAQSRFENSGAKLLITGQFLGFLRPFISLAAGASHYSLVRFTLAMLIGCFLWAVIPLAIGFFFGASWQKAVEYMKDFSLVLLVAIPLAFLSGWFIQRLLELSGSLYKFLDRLNHWIKRRDWYQRLSARHPRIFAFLERRISLSRNWGLGATFGFACALAVFGISLMIFWDVHTRDSWYRFDLSMVNLLAQLRTPGADRFFLTVTHLGSAVVVSIVVTLTALVCFFSRQHKSLFVVLGSVVVAVVLAQGLEYVFRRGRPDLALRLIEADGFSFPSGHATIAFTVFGTLYYWLWNHPGVLKVRATVAFLLLLGALLVGFSRVYLGVHYPSDVISGCCMGFASVLICGTIAANWSRLADVQQRADIPAAVILTVYGLSAWGYGFVNPIIPPKVEAGTERRQTLPQMEQVLPYLPKNATTIFGSQYVPVTLIVAGDPEPLERLLEQQEYKPVRAQDFFTRSLANPVFPAFLNGKPAARTLEKRLDEGRRILRLWLTSVEAGGRPLWLGSVVEHDREEKWRGIEVHRQTPDIDLALENLVEELDSVKSRNVLNFRRRGLYKWKNPFFTHGDVVFIEL